MRRFLFVAVASVFLPSLAHAKEDADTDGDGDGDGETMVVVEPSVPDEGRPQDPVKLPRRWVDVSYASDTLLLDGTAAATFVFGLATNVQPLPGLGVVTYGFGAPIVHFTHGNVGRGFADMGIRLVAPFVFAVPGLMLAMAATNGREPENRATAMDIGGFTGMALGAAFAMAVDALVLAKERIPEERAYFRDDASRARHVIASSR